jgi:2-polyprenyl-6-methoxyphenol hydroxylase-like FAD-dependent oxidoreductase
MIKDVTAEVLTAAKSHELPARYLVGCNGGHSMVRKRLRIASPASLFGVAVQHARRGDPRHPGPVSSQDRMTSPHVTGRVP